MKTKILKISTLAFFIFSVLFYVQFKTRGSTIPDLFVSKQTLNDSTNTSIITLGELKTIHKLVADSLTKTDYFEQEEIKKKESLKRAWSSKSKAPIETSDLSVQFTVDKQTIEVIKYFKNNCELSFHQLKSYASSTDSDWKLVNISTPINYNYKKYFIEKSYLSQEEKQKIIQEEIERIDPDRSTLKIVRMSSSKFRIPLTWNDFKEVSDEVNLIDYFKELHPETELTPYEIVDSMMAIPNYKLPSSLELLND